MKSLLRRIKNLWAMSDIYVPPIMYGENVRFSRDSISTEEMKHFIKSIKSVPPRPATIIQDELPDKLEENDSTN